MTKTIIYRLTQGFKIYATGANLRPSWTGADQDETLKTKTNCMLGLLAHSIISQLYAVLNAQHSQGWISNCVNSSTAQQHHDELAEGKKNYMKNRTAQLDKIYDMNYPNINIWVAAWSFIYERWMEPTGRLPLATHYNRCIFNLDYGIYNKKTK